VLLYNQTIENKHGNGGGFMTRKSTDPSPWGRLFNLKTDHPSGGGTSPMLTAQRIVSLPKLFSDYGDVLLDSVKEPIRQALIKFRLQLRARLAGKKEFSFELMRKSVEELWPTYEAPKFYLLYVSCSVPELYQYLQSVLKFSCPLTHFETRVLEHIKQESELDIGMVEPRTLNYLLARDIIQALEEKEHPHFDDQAVLRQLASFGSLRAFKRIARFIHSTSFQSIGEMRQFKHEVKNWYREMNAEENFGLLARVEYFMFLHTHVRTMLILQSIIFHHLTRELVQSGCLTQEKEKLPQDLRQDIEILSSLIKKFHEDIVSRRQELEIEFDSLLSQLYAGGAKAKLDFSQQGKLVNDDDAKKYGEKFLHWLFIYQEKVYNLVQERLQSKIYGGASEISEQKFDPDLEVAQAFKKSQAVLEEYEIQNEREGFKRFFTQAMDRDLIKDTEAYHRYITKIAPLMPYAVTVGVVQGRLTTKLVAREDNVFEPLRLSAQMIDVVVDAAPEATFAPPGC
jgi:hypothetical protein